MAQVRLILDKRIKAKRKSDGLYPILLRIFHRKPRTISMNVYTSELGWDKVKMRLTKSASANKLQDVENLNKELQKKYQIANTIIVDLGGHIKSVSIDDLIDRIKEEWNSNTNKSLVKSLTNGATLKNYGNQLIEHKLKSNRSGTAKWYQGAIDTLVKFNNGNDIKLIDINLSFLKSFEEFQLSKGNGKNTISAYLRALRAIYNTAIREEVFEPLKNPFDLYKIPRSKRTKKRAIAKEEFEKIRNLNYPIGSELWHSKNYALIMFNCRGMNFIDLVKLRVNSIENDRLFYGRSKTGELLSVKLTDELSEILAFYLKGKRKNDFIFPANYDGSNERFVEYNSHRRRTNKHLKIIAKDAGIETNLTTYSIRHSWATIAKYLGVPIPVISESLGHHSIKTTEIYLKEFDNSELDAANDLVTG